MGSLFGVDIRLHATLLLFMLWVGAIHVSAGQGWRGVVMGVALIAAVFGTVVLHELAHALMARRFGVRTRDITLLPIGGIARLEGMPRKPWQEVLVALVGPAVNGAVALLIAGFLWGTGGRLEPMALGTVGGAFLTKLMWINVSLGAFNLLPAFPMDGGRILRALLSLRMDAARATAIAARVGQVMAFVFGFIGLFFGPMLVLIAAFIWMGAASESAQVKLRAALEAVPVRDAMITDFKTLGVDEPLEHAAQEIVSGFQHDFPVVADGVLVGLLMRDDVVRGLTSGRAVAVGEMMHPDFLTAGPDERLDDLLERMQEHASDRGGTAVVVVDHGHVEGLVTPENIGELVMLKGALRRPHTARV